MNFNTDNLTHDLFSNEDLLFCKGKKDLIIMPAGQQARSFYSYLKDHDININYIIDNNYEKQGSEIDGITIISFEEYLEKYSEYSIFIATNEIIGEILEKQCIENGVENFHISDGDYLCFNTNEIDNARELLIKERNQIASVYNLLCDDFSRKTFVNLLNYRITHNNAFLKEIVRPEKSQYFEQDIYSITSKEYFVDCGAFDGDTLKQVMAITTNTIAGYFAFEPDENNFNALLKVARKHRNVNAIKKAIYKKNSLLQFKTYGNSLSKIGNSDGVKLEVVSLDSILTNKKVTFIKMDIEGSEIDALIGAKEIIREQMPVLAISVYHNFYDLLRIPLLIEKYAANYKYFLRHYTNKAIETVLYAVPQDQMINGSG
jgi:FkbM family methyltransferase